MTFTMARNDSNFHLRGNNTDFLSFGKFVNHSPALARETETLTELDMPEAVLADVLLIMLEVVPALFSLLVSAEAMAQTIVHRPGIQSVHSDWTHPHSHVHSHSHSQSQLQLQPQAGSAKSSSRFLSPPAKKLVNSIPPLLIIATIIRLQKNCVD